MAQITAQQAGGVNVVAFLDMLAWSEGTDNGKQVTKDRGYDVIVGGKLFNGYRDHPRVLVDLPKLKIQSTAAGRYQLLDRAAADPRAPRAAADPSWQDPGGDQGG
ncbi:hypothetical protein G6F62_014410 [Rhizopus arrhizus]|nr:hypothetical protein G6F62_014410 [Rhizopus arrhizus]